MHVNTSPALDFPDDFILGPSFFSQGFSYYLHSSTFQIYLLIPDLFWASEIILKPTQRHLKCSVHKTEFVIPFHPP